MSNPDKVYWDSSTYLDYLTGTHPLHDIMHMVIEDWRNGLVTLVTSALTIAEVYFVRINGRVDRNRDADIDALFDPPPEMRLVVVETSRLTAYSARDLARDHAIAARDAIHVASAIEAHCPVMHTNDSRLWDKSGAVGGDPLLRIEPPSWTRQLTAFEDSTEPPRPHEQSPGDAPG